MNSSDAHRQIRSALRAELKRRHGQIGQIEAELSRSEGYLSRFCRGDMEMTLKGCLEALEALDIEPGAFFSSALGSVTTADELIRRLARDGSSSRASSAIESAVAKTLESTPDADSSKRRRHRPDLREFKSEPIDVQLRRLRTAKKYRHADFVSEYRLWIECLRFDDPRSAMKLAAGVIQHVIPRMLAGRQQKIEFLCWYLATYASCARSLDDLESAFTALGRALELAGQSLLDVRADLLRRGGAFCTAVPDYETGFQLIREAQEIAFDREDDRSLGITVVVKGMLHLYSGHEEPASRCFQRGVRLLEPFDDDEVRRFKASAYTGQVNLFTNRGDHELARTWLTKAASALAQGGGLLVGKLYWQRGSIERVLGDQAAAAESFRLALELLEPGSVVDVALVSVELATTLLESGRHREAIRIAKGMASLTDSMWDNQLAQGALVEFLRIVLAGDLDLAVLARFKSALEKGRPRKGALQDRR